MSGIGIKFTYDYAKKAMDAMIEKANTANNLASNIIGSPYGKGEFKRFTDKGAEFSYEYNDACHCHPEWRTKEYFIPSEWIDAIKTNYIIPLEENIGEFALSEFENESEDTSLLETLIKEHKLRLEANKVELARLEQERKKREEEEIKAKQEKREREEFERLAKKFNDT